MSSLVGGTGIIGQDMVCGFGKKGYRLTSNDFEKGGLGSDGVPNSDFAKSRTKNFYKIKEGTTYEFICNENRTVGPRFYDKDYNFVNYTWGNGNGYLKCIIPKNVCYFRLQLTNSPTTTLEVTIREVS